MFVRVFRITLHVLPPVRAMSVANRHCYARLRKKQECKMADEPCRSALKVSQCCTIYYSIKIVLLFDVVQFYVAQLIILCTPVICSTLSSHVAQFDVAECIAMQQFSTFQLIT